MLRIKKCLSSQLTGGNSFIVLSVFVSLHQKVKIPLYTLYHRWMKFWVLLMRMLYIPFWRADTHVKLQVVKGYGSFLWSFTEGVHLGCPGALVSWVTSLGRKRMTAAEALQPDRCRLWHVPAVRPWVSVPSEHRHPHLWNGATLPSHRF